MCREAMCIRVAKLRKSFEMRVLLAGLLQWLDFLVWGEIGGEWDREKLFKCERRSVDKKCGEVL